MERLPYIDEHAITIEANRDDTWAALLRVLCRDPHDPSTVPLGLDEARPPVRFALKGRHPFAVYRWVFELDTLDGPARTRLRAATWAAFPGHRHRRAPHRRSAHAEPCRRPGAGGDAVRWVHRHVLRLGGWTIVRSARDEVVLAARGPLMDAPALPSQARRASGLGAGRPAAPDRGTAADAARRRHGSGSGSHSDDSRAVKRGARCSRNAATPSAASPPPITRSCSRVSSAATCRGG